MSDRYRLILAALVIPLVVIIDQWTKFLVYSNDTFNAFGCLDGTDLCGEIGVLPFFKLEMVWNRGISFGLGQSHGIMRWVLFAVTAAIAIGFAIWLYKADRWKTGTGLALVVGGAIGNMIDRARFGAVVDFLNFDGIWPPYFFNYVFNVADSAVTIGAALLFLDQFLLARDEKKAGSVSK